MVAAEASFVIDSVVGGELVDQVHRLIAGHAFLGRTRKSHCLFFQTLVLSRSLLSFHEQRRRQRGQGTARKSRDRGGEKRKAGKREKKGGQYMMMMGRGHGVTEGWHLQKIAG